MYKKFVAPILLAVALITVLIIPYFAFAQTAPMKQLDALQPATGYAPVSDENNAPRIAGTIISAALSLLGIIFLILILIAGYNWMTAAGDASKVEKAQDTMRRAVIGLLIVVGAYAIAQYVVFKVILDA
jgi:hypothetical protein